MRISRRRLMQAGLAAGAVSMAPRAPRAEATPSDARTFRVVKASDLRVFDPIWTTANITADHGAMIYDTLFSLDSSFKSQPQMVGRWGMSDDKKTYTFELRDSLGWHDGTNVTARDCVESIRRWGQVDPGGQAIMARAADISAKDDKTFVIALKQPFGLLVELLGKATTPCCFIMREKDASRPATEQISANIGSGPFTFNHALAKPGASFTYDRNAKYVPRSEAPNGLAGGKVAKLDRVIWENIADPQTALAALQAGEIDYVERPPLDLITQLQADPNITVDVLDKNGEDTYLRMNFLQKPFNDVKARQAILHLVDQKAFMQAAFGDPKWYSTVASPFGNGTPMSNDDNTGWFKQGVDLDKSRQLLKEAGYAGGKVVILQATNADWQSNCSQYLAAQLRKVGINVELAPSDWGGVVTRRANKEPVDQGGWSIFISQDSDYSHGDPLGTSFLLANGPKAWYGWPSNDEYELLRNKWADADTLEERKGIARQMQRLWWEFVGSVLLGQHLTPTAYRKNIKGIIGMPEIVPFWNVEKA
ncbi:peptide/nickel transport system substrate-binding protein [Rhizobiales bacterium GAS191]|nr:peptide/nickel transport system substrate-binding protein [Rhizobiales bacterium GAS191]